MVSKYITMLSLQQTNTDCPPTPALCSSSSSSGNISCDTAYWHCHGYLHLGHE